MISLDGKRVKEAVIQSMFTWSSPEQIRKTEEVEVSEGELEASCRKHLLLSVGRLHHQQVIVNPQQQSLQVIRSGNLMADHPTDKVNHHNMATGALLLNVEVNGVMDLDPDLHTLPLTVDIARDHLVDLLARLTITCRHMEILLGVHPHTKDIHSPILATILQHKDNHHNQKRRSSEQMRV